jgi:hypothetical protein
MSDLADCAAEPVDDGEFVTPVWLSGTLTVRGPMEATAAFQDAACGPGAVPWAWDLVHEEARLLALLAGSGRSARGLVQAIRVQQEATYGRLLAAAAQPGGGCALDLHRLLPVPTALLGAGEDAPESVRWLRTHWGPLVPLREVRLKQGQARGRGKQGWLIYRFLARARLPTPAAARLKRRWPTLSFELDGQVTDEGGGSG